MTDFKYFKQLIAGKATVDGVIDSNVLFFFGLGFANPIAASSINHLIFSIDKRLFSSLLIKKFKGQKYPSWIKKPKSQSDLIQEYCNKNNVKRDSIIEQLIKENYEAFLHEMKVDEKVFRKEGYTLKKPEKRIENEWF